MAEKPQRLVAQLGVPLKALLKAKASLGARLRMWLSVWLRGDWSNRSRKRPCKCAVLRSVGQEPVRSRHIVCLALQRQWLQSTKHKAQSTEHGTRNTEHGTRNKNGRLFGKHVQYGRCRFCRASLGAMQQMSMFFVAPIVLRPLPRRAALAVVCVATLAIC